MATETYEQLEIDRIEWREQHENALAAWQTDVTNLQNRAAARLNKLAQLANRWSERADELERLTKWQREEVGW